MTMLRLAKFAIPMEVATKNVGNMRGCDIHSEQKVPTTPNLANPTRTGKIQPELLTLTHRMASPAMLYKAKPKTKMTLARYLATKYPAPRHAGTSQAVITIILTEKSPGKYLTCRLIM